MRIALCLCALLAWTSDAWATHRGSNGNGASCGGGYGSGCGGGGGVAVVRSNGGASCYGSVAVARVGCGGGYGSGAGCYGNNGAGCGGGYGRMVMVARQPVAVQLPSGPPQATQLPAPGTVPGIGDPKPTQLPADQPKIGDGPQAVQPIAPTQPMVVATVCQPVMVVAAPVCGDGSGGGHRRLFGIFDRSKIRREARQAERVYVTPY